MFFFSDRLAKFQGISLLNKEKYREAAYSGNQNHGAIVLYNAHFRQT
jgi:hypothetical protein